jgi:hypothetical protein
LKLFVEAVAIPDEMTEDAVLLHCISQHLAAVVVTSGPPKEPSAPLSVIYVQFRESKLEGLLPGCRGGFLNNVPKDLHHQRRRGFSRARRRRERRDLVRACHHVGVLKNGMSSLISTIHDVVLVHSKSKALMKSSRKRFPEFPPPRLEKPALRAG